MVNKQAPILFVETDSGGRTISGSTYIGEFKVVWDKDGKLVSESMVIRQGVPPEILSMTDITSRADICTACESSISVSREVNGYPVWAVNCKECGCGNKKLDNSNCPLDKW